MRRLRRDVYRVGGDICPDARLVKGIKTLVGVVKHAVDLEDVAVFLFAAEFIAGSLVHQYE
jgi:MFS-type transporter involved in bile tolerance (Atg22 family)